MSATTLYEKGLKAAERKDFAAAVPLLTAAIEASGAANPNPAWLLTRARAEMGTQAYQDALDDADRAYQSALSRQSAQSKRWLVQAQYRRAVALAALKRYADADACCLWSQQLAEGRRFRGGGDDGKDEEDDVRKNVDGEGRYRATLADLPKTLTSNPGHNAASTGGGTGNTLAGVLGQANNNDSTKADWTQAYMWRGVVLRELQKLPMGDPGRRITVSRVPSLPKKRATVKAAPAATETKEVKEVKKEEAQPTTTPAAAAAAPTQTPSASAPAAPAKLRVDMYQTPTTVNLTLYAKGVDAKSLEVKATGNKSVQLSSLPATIAGPSQIVTLALAGSISTSEPVETRVTPYKIELKVVKANAGEKWGHWGEQAAAEGAKKDLKEKQKENVAPAAAAPIVVPVVEAPKAAPAEKAAEKAAEKTAAPSKSTSSAAAPSYPTSSKTGPKNWDKVDLDDDDDEENSNVDDFFKKLYAGSTPEQQRAMMKSFTESNGTSLSTDWSTVGKGPVAVVPPEGVEAKKWEK
ncbi:Cochaperone protein [Sporothrix stenoceras]|uniref:Cochaperone protein n=1 Tax=Sporothrix stenoceras TaxID=5173 RepID=A0ABR3Z047_9PEZI